MAEKIEPAMKQAWPGPEGLIPVTDGSTSDANVITRRYLDSILFQFRMIDTCVGDLTFTLWSETFSSPVMLPAFSHLSHVGKDGKDPMVEYAIAAKNMNLVNWVGMESNEEFQKILDTGAKTIRIIKPFADHKMILDQIRYSEEHGAFAVGIDIDHSIGDDGNYDVVDGYPLGPISLEDLKKFVQSTHLPFVAKGVLSVDDAKKCLAAGVSGIVISHHHGRLPFAMPPVQLLPEVQQAVGKQMKIFVDCHMDTGYDAYKALALGADAVSVGRPILRGLIQEGSPAVEKVLMKVNAQLKQTMGYTGIAKLSEMNDEALVMPEK